MSLLRQFHDVRVVVLILGVAAVSMSAMLRKPHNNKYYEKWMPVEELMKLNVARQIGDLDRMKEIILDQYNSLALEQRDEIDPLFRQFCNYDWLKKVATQLEHDEFMRLYEDDEDRAAVRQRAEAYRRRLPEAEAENVRLWQDECRGLWGVKSRQRRSFEAFTEWLPDDLRARVRQADEASGELLAAIVAYVDAAAPDDRKSIVRKGKEHCRAFFSALATSEELAKMRELHDAGRHPEVRALVDGAIARQPDATRREALKAQAVCDSIYMKRVRRSFENLVEKHLSWLTQEQRQELLDMNAAKKTHEEIKSKVMEFYLKLDGPLKADTKNQLTKACYAWLQKAATEEEISALHKMHEVDHTKCKSLVREYIKRLPEAQQAEVNRNLPFCERIWYGEHANHHHHHQHRRALHHTQ